MSVSWMAELEACRLVWVTDRLLIVCWRRFWVAPRLARVVETVWMAVSTAVMPASAPACVARSTPAVPRVAESLFAMLTEMVSPEA